MDRKERIAYIVPSEASKASVEKILNDEITDGVLDVLMVDIHDPEGEYCRLSGEGYSCIIARGGTYNSILPYVNNVPVIEESIRTADILGMIAETGVTRDETICIVLHQNVADGAEDLEKISGGRCKVYRYKDIYHLRELLAEMPETNVRVFSSGYASTSSDREDLEFIEILNRPQTIRETVNTARIFLSQMQDNIKQVNTLNSIYNNIDEGILIFNKEEVVTEANTRAISMLGRDRTKVIGSNVSELISGMPARRKDGKCSIDFPRNFTGKLGKTQINYTIYPFDLYHGEQCFMMILQDVTKIQMLEQNIRVELSKKGLVAKHHFEDIMTCEKIMEHVISKARTIAGHEGSVIIYGESGTGKELFAQSIHNASTRSSGPFVAVNCSALSESLLESELFGYVGGSFTGARKEGKPGLFELAHNGTIFLDEINSTPLNLQTKILRVIESQQVMRVGSDYVIPLDIRIISASNGDLEKDMDDGKFRRDLYYRLNTFEITVPSVRERKADIMLLFKYYLAKFSDGQLSPDSIVIDPDFEQQLLSHKWLGNVREIRSTALRYSAFGGDNSAGDILKTSNPSEATGESIADSITDGEMIPLSALSGTVENLVITALEQKGLSRTDIAKALGISRQALYKKMNKE